MLRLLTVLAVLCFCRSEIISIRYPQNNPCLLIDIDATLNLLWVDSDNGNQSTGDFTFANAKADSGICSKASPSPIVTLVWSDSRTFSFYFNNQSNSIVNSWQLKYSPASVFNNNKTGVITHTGNIGTATSASKAYTCKTFPVFKDERDGVGMNKYTLTFKINYIKTQAFGVSDGSFSEEEKCAADAVSTQKSPASSVSTNPSSVSTKPSSVSTKPSTGSTKPSTGSTKPSTGSTKPSTGSTKPSSPSASTNATTKPTSSPTTKPSTGSTKTTNPTTQSTSPTTKTTNATTKPTTGSTKPSTVTTQPTKPTTPAPPPNGHSKQTFEVFGDDKQCVLMQGEFLFTLTYPKEDGKNATVDIGVQEIKSVTGDCNATGGLENVVSVEFYDNWQMDLTISKTKKTSDALLYLEADDSNEYYWSDLYLQYSYDTKLGGKPLFPDVKTGATAVPLNVSLPAGTYEASTGGSFLCNANQRVDLGDGNSLQTWNLQYDAFNTQNHTSFSDKDLKECSADSKTSSVVPIAVGAALAGLVVIVLIAYLIGRRRNRKGYESV